MLRWLTKRHKEVAPRKRWRERLTIGLLLNTTVLTAILCASLTVGYYALDVLRNNKLADIWAIMFLELEHEGTELTRRLTKIGAESDFNLKDADAVLEVDKVGALKTISGGLSDVHALDVFGIKSPEVLQDLPTVTVWSRAGERYLVRYEKDTTGEKNDRLYLRKIRPKILALRPAHPVGESALYLVSREGDLLYSSDEKITSFNYSQQPLVQHFIRAPIKQGQFEIAGAGGKVSYGFFTEMPESNLILFSELSKSVALGPIRQIEIRFVLVLVGILALVGLLMQVSLSKIVTPLRELAFIAGKVASGNFDVSPQSSGFGEMMQLNAAFSSMTTGLKARDLRLALLMEEQKEKFRLAGELAIAKRIQENLLPDAPIPRESGLVISAAYVAATECAGDWYHYSFNKVTGETIVVLADVSGHGAGSSVFTAIIAGIFEECRARTKDRFDIEEFLKNVNQVIFKLGRQQWHATMLIARYILGKSELDLVSAGHPMPFLKGKVTGTASVLLPPTSVLGLQAEFKAQVHKREFFSGDSILLFTDGLVEARDRRSKMFSRRRVRDSLQDSPAETGEILNKVLNSWKKYCDGAEQDDDVCIIVMRAA